MCSGLNVSVVTYETPRAEVERLIQVVTESNLINRVFLVENGKTPPDWASHHAKVECIHRPDNPGYGSGHNIALRRSVEDNVPYHLVVNADVDVKLNVIVDLIEYLQRYKSVGLVSPKIINADGSDQGLCKILPRPIDLLNRILPIRIYGARDIKIRNSGKCKNVSAPYLSGCFMLFRVAALSEIGYFDERFFMYPEDIDISRRMYAKHDCVMKMDQALVHKHGGASKRSVRMFYIHAINMIKYFNKWGWVFDGDRERLNAISRQRNMHG